MRTVCLLCVLSLFLNCAVGAGTVNSQTARDTASVTIHSIDVVDKGMTKEVTIVWSSYVDPVDSETSSSLEFTAGVYPGGGGTFYHGEWYPPRMANGEHTSVINVPGWFNEAMITVSTNNDETSASEDQGILLE